MMRGHEILAVAKRSDQDVKDLSSIVEYLVSFHGIESISSFIPEEKIDSIARETTTAGQMNSFRQVEKAKEALGLEDANSSVMRENFGYDGTVWGSALDVGASQSLIFLKVSENQQEVEILGTDLEVEFDRTAVEVLLMKKDRIHQRFLLRPLLEELRQSKGLFPPDLPLKSLTVDGALPEFKARLVIQKIRGFYDEGSPRMGEFEGFILF